MSTCQPSRPRSPRQAFSVKARSLVITSAVLVGGLLVAPSASAATCSDYSNQAAAQRAADTRDADGDGAYCESLPCPCQRAGAGSPRPKPRPVSRPRPKPRSTGRRAQRIDAQIVEVIDGDTVRVSARGPERRLYTVRLIGIDTPETRKPGAGVECGGKQATASMLRLSFSAPEDSDGDGLLDAEGGQGRRVTLTTDPSQDTFDRYRRLLAYVETRGGEQLNVEQVAAGWAETYVYNDKPFRQVARFWTAERRARAAKRGVWGACGGDFHRPDTASAGAVQPGSVCSRRLALRTLREKRRIGRGQARFAQISTPPICADLTGEGEPELAFTVTIGGSGGDIYWGILRRNASGRVSVSPFESGRGFGLRIENGALAVATPIYRRGDPGCCPTGGWRVRRFAWNGARFVRRSSRVEPEVPEGFYDR